MNPSKDCLLIFTKNPILGKVKTRLAKTVGEERALQIYKALLKHTFEITQYAPCDKKVFYTDFIDEDDLWNGFQKYMQIQGDLGQKMQAAFAEAFQEGYERVVIVGSDCFELTEKDVAQAFAALQSAQVVIGPARDGGYYLLGMTGLIPSLFAQKKWSTAEVLPSTLADLAQLGTKPFLLPERNDIDEWEDLPESWR